MDTIIAFLCLKCRRELWARKEEVNIRITEGIICSHCNHVMWPSDFITETVKDKLTYPPSLHAEEIEVQRIKQTRLIRFKEDESCQKTQD